MSPSRPVRWWPALVLLGLAVAVLVWLWWGEPDSHQQRFVDTLGTILLLVLGLMAWLLLLSRARWHVRLGGMAGALLVLTGLGLSVRMDGVSGDLVPILRWRWSEPPGQSLPSSPPPAAPRADAAGPDDPAQDFPQFLGPRRDGTLPGVRLARDWAARPPVEVWRRPVGPAWSGFAVSGERAITQEQRGERELVICYHRRTGAVLWTHGDLARYESPLAGIGPRATPAIAGKTVYALGATGRLNALDLDSGAVIWSRDLAGELGGEPPRWGVAASPLVLERMVVVEAGDAAAGALLALDRETGQVLWRAGAFPPGYSSPVAATLAGRRQILAFHAGALAGHDAGTGEVLWEHPWPPVGETEHTSQPVVLPGDRVFQSAGYGVGGKLYQLAPDSQGGVTAQVVWESPRLKAKFTNVVLHDGFLYGLDDGVLVCLDPADGQRRWKGGRYGHGQILLAGDLILVMAESGEVVLVEAVPEAHRELGGFQALTGKTWNHPALSGPYLLVRNDREAACYRLHLAG